jgi:hypothetical protein
MRVKYMKNNKKISKFNFYKLGNNNIKLKQ